MPTPMIHSGYSAQKPVNTPRLIDIENAVSNPAVHWFIRRFKGPIENFLAVNSCNQIYAIHSKQSCRLEDFFKESLTLLNIDLKVSETDLKRIPVRGPLIVIANHPFGGVEGAILACMIGKVRPDLKIIGNYLLQKIPEISGHIIPVDPFGSSSSIPANAAAVKQAIGWVREGGALILFPAGEVSHLSLRNGRIADPPWSPHLGGIVRKTKAKVLPVFFPGKNSAFFQFAGLIHPRIRTALLARELMEKTRSTIEIHIGQPIAWQKLKSFRSAEAMTQRLRSATYLLRYRSSKGKKRFQFASAPKAVPKSVHAIIGPVSKKTLEKEIAALPKDSLVAQSGDFEAYLAESAAIPCILREIGRLREISFRSVDEGSGKSLDIDRFDVAYHHLFLWNRKDHEIIGAYRLGLCDRILETSGLSGLYSNSLFQFKKELVRELRHSIELGRSFIRPEYQRRPSCLSLLWCGIGEFISRHPRYKVMFGPVSISRSYHAVSKTLMIEFLKRACSDPGLAPHVRPRRPFRPGIIRKIALGRTRCTSGTIEDISMLVSGLEKDGKGVPVLIRHYLKLDGKFLAFNVDKNFSNVVDGLVFVDLTTTHEKILKRFMSPEGLARFSLFHHEKKKKAA